MMGYLFFVIFVFATAAVSKIVMCKDNFLTDFKLSHFFFCMLHDSAGINKRIFLIKRKMYYFLDWRYILRGGGRVLE